MDRAYLLGAVDQQTTRAAGSGTTSALPMCSGESDLNACEPNSGFESDLALTESALVLKSDDREPTRKVQEKLSEIQKWQPFWSRPAILNVFGVLFANIMAISIFVAVYSKVNHGLANAYDDLAYVWRFGPTAFFTFVAALWSRTELQVLRYTPWEIVQLDGVTPNNSVLDYTEMLLPMVLLRSLKHRHLLVFVAAATTLALKVQIALSSSILQPISIHKTDILEVQIHESFQQSANLSALKIDLDPDVYALAVEHFGVDLPFGISSECAYETFTAESLDGQPVVPTVEEPVRAIVDGLFMDTECLLLEDYTVSVDHTEDPRNAALVVDLRFENCEQPIRYRASQALGTDSRDGTFHHLQHSGELAYSNITDRPCSSLPQQNQQYMYIITNSYPSPQNASHVHLRSCAAALCSSHAWLSKVEIVDDGINRLVSLSAEQGANTSFIIDPLQLLTSSGTLDRLFGKRMDEDPEAKIGVFGMGEKRFDSSDDTLTNSRPLSEFFRQAVKNYAPMVAHLSLRKKIEARGFGTQKAMVARLGANFGICLSIAAVSGICAIFIMLSSRSSCIKVDSYRRDPTTLLGSIIQLHGRQQQYRSTRSPQPGPPIETKKTRKASWIQNAYSSLVLRPFSRSLLVLFVLGLIASISSTLQRSEAEDGLFTLPNSAYWPAFIQLIPVLAMLIVSVFASSLDTAIRSLATLAKLSLQSCPSSEMDISLADMLGIQVLFHSVRLRLPSVGFVQVLATLCGLLPVIGSVLLLPKNMPKVDGIIIDEQQSWFGTREVTKQNIKDFVQNRDFLSYLSLVRSVSNFTSPAYTYLDLLFPTFSLSDSRWVPGASATVKMSAAKLWPSCERLSDNDFQIVNETQVFPLLPSSVNTTHSTRERLDVTLLQHVKCGNNTQRNMRLPLRVGTDFESRDLAYFGQYMPSSRNPNVKQTTCTDGPVDTFNLPWLARTYIWGRYSHSRAVYDHMTVWECNYTWVDISTHVNLLWAQDGFLIDHNNPPVQDNTTIRPWDPPFAVPIFDFSTIDSSCHTLQFDEEILWSEIDAFKFPGESFEDSQLGVSGQFRHILEPYGPLKLNDFSDPDREDYILEQLHSRVAFSGAQLASVEQRLGLDERSDAYPYTTPGYNGREITGIITDHTRQRLVQSRSITFTLIAILSLVAGVHIWGLASDCWRWHRSSGSRRRHPWLLDLGLRGVAPPGFSSLALMTSLLEGSNCSRVLPENAHLMAPRDLYRYLDGKEFRLGWFDDAKTKSEVYTIGALNDCNLIYRGEKRT